jgi:PHD/YefM family antitoxin component YafN of YafNO toxin-antitoxin module
MISTISEVMETFTIEEFQADFDTLMSRVENGESFIITSEHGNAVMVPYKEVISICEDANVDFEDIVKIHTDHEEGS